jgi:hypothetical protein
MRQPPGWSEHGLPCLSSGTAPPFLWPEKQLREHGLIPGGGRGALVESQYGPAALYLITDTALADPRAWPSVRPAAATRAESHRNDKERTVTEPHRDDKERLCTLLAMLPWQHAPDGLFPPDAWRELMLGVDADSAPESGAAHDERWEPLTNVASEFGRLLTAGTQTPPRATIPLAMHVLRAFEPLDPHVAKAIGGLLPVDTTGRLWVGDVIATAWQVMSSELGHQRLAELQHDLRRM